MFLLFKISVNQILVSYLVHFTKDLSQYILQFIVAYTHPEQATVNSGMDKLPKNNFSRNNSLKESDQSPPVASSGCGFTNTTPESLGQVACSIRRCKSRGEVADWNGGHTVLYSRFQGDSPLLTVGNTKKRGRNYV